MEGQLREKPKNNTGNIPPKRSMKWDFFRRAIPVAATAFLFSSCQPLQDGTYREKNETAYKGIKKEFLLDSGKFGSLGPADSILRFPKDGSESPEQDSVSQKQVNVSQKFTQVPVFMFHGFENTKGKLCNIPPDEFRSILQLLYENDFFAISGQEFISGDFTRIPEGKKPVLLTFDDARATQFKYSNVSDSTISGSCAVGMLMDFFASHADFGFGGVFFVTFGTDNFGGETQVGQKINHLLSLGFEVGNHTVTHPLFGKIGTARARQELADYDALAAQYLGGRAEKIRLFAYPGGSFPADAETDSLVNSKFDGVFDALGGIAPTKYGEGYNPKRIPRIEGTLSNVRRTIWKMR